MVNKGTIRTNSTKNGNNNELIESFYLTEERATHNIDIFQKAALDGLENLIRLNVDPDYKILPLVSGVEHDSLSLVPAIFIDYDSIEIKPYIYIISFAEESVYPKIDSFYVTYYAYNIQENNILLTTPIHTPNDIVYEKNQTVSITSTFTYKFENNQNLPGLSNVPETNGTLLTNYTRTNGKLGNVTFTLTIDGIFQATFIANLGTYRQIRPTITNSSDPQEVFDQLITSVNITDNFTEWEVTQNPPTYDYLLLSPFNSEYSVRYNILDNSSPSQNKLVLTVSNGSNNYAAHTWKPLKLFYEPSGLTKVMKENLVKYLDGQSPFVVNGSSTNSVNYETIKKIVDYHFEALRSMAKYIYEKSGENFQTITDVQLGKETYSIGSIGSQSIKVIVG